MSTPLKTRIQEATSASQTQTYRLMFRLLSCGLVGLMLLSLGYSFFPFFVYGKLSIWDGAGLVSTLSVLLPISLLVLVVGHAAFVFSRRRYR